VHAESHDDYRVVIDENSLDWRELTMDELREALDTFADLLQPMADGRHVAFMSTAYGVECRTGLCFTDLPYTPYPEVPRDARVRLARLLDRCVVVEPDENDLPQPIRIEGVEYAEPSWGLSHALARSATGRAMSCLVVLYASRRSGWTIVDCWAGKLNMHFMSRTYDVPVFWRQVLTLESTSESTFFALKSLAFPNLLFATDLNFHGFNGRYPDVLPWVVKLLGAVSDQFADTITHCRGDHNQVIAQFDALGLEISPESPSTRKNSRAWAQRLVNYEKVPYRCEWHGKRLWNHDRVHFSLPIAELGNKVLIGIFVDHLDT